MCRRLNRVFNTWISIAYYGRSSLYTILSVQCNFILPSLGTTICVHDYCPDSWSYLHLNLPPIHILCRLLQWCMADLLRCSRNDNSWTVRYDRFANDHDTWVNRLWWLHFRVVDAIRWYNKNATILTSHSWQKEVIINKKINQTLILFMLLCVQIMLNDFSTFLYDPTAGLQSVIYAMSWIMLGRFYLKNE